MSEKAPAPTPESITEKIDASRAASAVADAELKIKIKAHRAAHPKGAGNFSKMSDKVDHAAKNAGKWEENRDWDLAIAEDQARDSRLKAESIEERRNSEEVRDLNDAAEIAIYGTKGKTEGFVDSDGNPLERPIKGLLEEIRENPRYGTKAADREAAAKKYADGIEKLVAKGFELCQAKMIMDKREHLSRVSGAKKTLLTKSARKFEQIIKENGIFSEEEYDEWLASRGVDADGVGGHTATTKIKTPDMPEITPERAAELDDLLKRQREARDRYAKLSAQRGTKWLHLRGTKKEDLAEAEDELRKIRDERNASRRELLAYEMQRALAAGVSPEDITAYSELFAMDETTSLIGQVYNERLIATGQHERTSEGGIHGIREVETNNPLLKARNKFLGWWGKQADEKFLSTATLKKGAVMAAAGAVVGVPAALAGTVILGPVAGGALGAVIATRVSKGVMANFINKKGGGTKRIRQYDIDAYMAHGGGKDVVGELTKQTETEVTRNRKRVGFSAIAGFAGGTLGMVGAEHILGFGNGGDSHDHITTAHNGSGGTAPEDNPNTGGTAPGEDTGGTSGTDQDPNPKAPEKHPTLKLHLKHDGDSIWEENKNYLASHGYDSSDASVQKLTQAVIDTKSNNVTWDSAHNLPIGYEFKVPQGALAEISKIDEK